MVVFQKNCIHSVKNKALIIEETCVVFSSISFIPSNRQYRYVYLVLLIDYIALSNPNLYCVSYSLWRKSSKSWNIDLKLTFKKIKKEQFRTEQHYWVELMNKYQINVDTQTDSKVVWVTEVSNCQHLVYIFPFNCIYWYVALFSL